MLPYGPWPADTRRSSGTTEYNAEVFSVVLIKVKSRDKNQVEKVDKIIDVGEYVEFPTTIPSQHN